MKTNQIIAATFTTLLMSFSSAAFSAGYIKFDGVDGESKSSRSAPAAETNKIQDNQTKPAALLLPAVQKVREAASTDSGSTSGSKKKGKVEASWKVEEGTK
jgi:hypothetical protein